MSESVLTQQTKNNLTELLGETSPKTLSDEDKLVIFSDLHMGNGKKDDDFLHNSGLFRFVLRNHYLKKDYQLVLNGDVEELQKFALDEIIGRWKEIYQVFEQFKEKTALYRIVGNHDYDLVYRASFKKELLHALKFNYQGQPLFIFHGHQASRFYEKFNFLATFILRYFAHPLGIKNVSPAYDSGKRYKIEKSVYHFSAGHKLLSIIGHTHRPLFESLSKVDSLKFKIERLCRDYIKASPDDKIEMEILIKKYKDELRRIYHKKDSYGFQSSIYGELIIPCLFNSGTVIGKRGITAIEIAGGKISLVHWFHEQKSKKYFTYFDVEPTRLGNSDIFRVELKSDYLAYIFTRINLLTD